MAQTCKPNKETNPFLAAIGRIQPIADGLTSIDSRRVVFQMRAAQLCG
jgi:hypothetical protein